MSLYSAKQVTKKTREAADKFVHRLFGTERSFPYHHTWKKVNYASELVLAAFVLYHMEWAGRNPLEWKWPFAQLEAPNPFAGEFLATENVPWTVLLRRAWELSVEVKLLPEGQR